MSMSKDCCTTAATSTDYQPIGKIEKLDDLEVYVTGSGSKGTVVAFYDVFGFNPNTFHFLDLIAANGYRVIVPDFFRGRSWDVNGSKVVLILFFIWLKIKSLFYSKDQLFEHVSGFTVKDRAIPDIKKVFEHYGVNEGDKVVGLGFCWGAALLSIDARSNNRLFSAGVMIHPSFVDLDDLKKFKIPMNILATSSEKTLVDGFNGIETEVAKESQVVDFTDASHGFAAARANFKDAKDNSRIQDAVQVTVEFLEKHLT